MEQEAEPPSGAVPVVVPAFMKEILAEFTRHVRSSPHVNQRSGVSVRFSIGNLETVAASAVRRAIRAGEPEAVPRPCDLPAALQSSLGRIEFESYDEGREVEIMERMLRQAELDVYRRKLGGFDLSKIVARFDQGLEVDTGDLVPGKEFLEQLGAVPGLAQIMRRLGIEEESPGQAAAALELALEGLHLSKRLNKDAMRNGIRYSAR